MERHRIRAADTPMVGSQDGAVVGKVLGEATEAGVAGTDSAAVEEADKVVVVAMVEAMGLQGTEGKAHSLGAQNTRNQSGSPDQRSLSEH